MSVIVKTPDDKIMCMTKGADSIIAARLATGQDNLLNSTTKILDEYANEGLRTLLLAQREIDPKEYSDWNAKYQKALLSMKNREQQIK